MNFNFIKTVLGSPSAIGLGIAVAIACPSSAGAVAPTTTVGVPASGPGSRESALRRVVALLDYVAGDYARAVGEGGQILAADEYREQLGFVFEAARELRAEGGDEGRALAVRLDGLLARIEEKRPPSLVGPLARALRDEVSQRFGIILLPAQMPDLARGAALFEVACQSCHGAGGHLPATLAELQLSTKPMAFASAEETRPLTPQRAFSASTYGVPNTAMPGYEEAYDDKARWDLAYYVLSLARGPGSAKGVALARTALVPTSYRELAVLSNEALEERLGKAGLSPEGRDEVLRALRGGPFSEEGASALPGRLGAARRAIADAAAIAGKGDRETARRAVLSSYLDDFEPHEPTLRARDGALVTSIERAYLELRSALEEPRANPAPAFETLDGLLAKADASAGSSGSLLPFVAALAIALREGVEAALLVAALLALLRKAGRERDAKAVHLGWAAALALGVATWFLSGAVLSLSGMKRELAEGVVQLVTAALLLWASHWLLAAASAKRLIGFLHARATRGSALVVFGLAFGAIYREMFETVIFFRGLLLESAGAGHAVLFGALTGLALLAVLVAVFQKVGKRLQPRPLLLACGVLLCGLAVVMVGNGTRALQEIGALPVKVWSGVRLPALGLFGTREGLLAQALVLFGLIASALWSVRQRKKREARQPQPPTGSGPAAAQPG